MSEDDREETLPKKERKEDTTSEDEGLSRGDVAAQEQKRILKEAKE